MLLERPHSQRAMCMPVGPYPIGTLNWGHLEGVQGEVSWEGLILVVLSLAHLSLGWHCP